MTTNHDFFDPELVTIPPEWEKLEISRYNGLVMVIGAPDAGKSTFARYLYHRMSQEGKNPAYLDGDPGQSFLGPPTTLTLGMGLNEGSDQLSGYYSMFTRIWRSFIGSVTPRGHMLDMLVGAERLVRAANQQGVELVVYDTCGLVDPLQGGFNLKMGKIDLLHPTTVIALQKGTELEPLLVPLRRSRRTHLVELHPSPEVQERSAEFRKSFRASQFAKYFSKSVSLVVDWCRIAVMPWPRFSLNRLVALEDAGGFTLGLGIVVEISRPERWIRLLTPVTSLEGIDTLRLGDVRIDLHTYQETQEN